MAKTSTSVIIIIIFFTIFILVMLIWAIINTIKLTSNNINEGSQNIFCLRLVCRNDNGEPDRNVPVNPVKLSTGHVETLNYCTANAPPGEFQELIRGCSVDPSVMSTQDMDLFADFLSWYPNNYTKTCGNSWIISPSQESSNIFINGDNEYGTTDANLICWATTCAEKLNFTNKTGYNELKSQCESIPIS